MQYKSGPQLEGTALQLDWEQDSRPKQLWNEMALEILFRGSINLVESKFVAVLRNLFLIFHTFCMKLV